MTHVKVTRTAMGSMDINEYKDTHLHKIPHIILRPIICELNQASGWQELIKEAEKLHEKYALRPYEIAEISKAILVLNNLDTCSDRLMREYGSRGMTLSEMSQCLFNTRKFENSLIESGIKEKEELQIITQPEAELTVVEGNPLRLICKAVGFPYPRYTWFRYDEVVHQGVYDGSLHLNVVRKEHEGEYTCRVHNLHMDCLFSIKCYVTINPNPNPKPALNLTPVIKLSQPYDPPPGFLIQPVAYPNLTLKLKEETSERVINKRFGESLKLHFVADGHPPPSYRWYRNDELISSQTNSTLYVSQLKLSNSGIYYCEAFNDIHPSIKSKTFTVQVTDSSVTRNNFAITHHPGSIRAEEGTFVVLKTRTNARNVVYKWVHNKQHIKPSDTRYSIVEGELQIKRASFEHSGLYECVVELRDSETNAEVATIHSNTATLEVVPDTRNLRMPIAKVALLLGNASYRNDLPPLPGVRNDMHATRKCLENMDFKVMSFMDLSLHEMYIACKLFKEFVHENVYVVLFFCGHGFSDGCRQFLIPSDAPHDAQTQDCLCIEHAYTSIMDNKPEMTLIVNDMCRHIVPEQISAPPPNPCNGKFIIYNSVSQGQRAFEYKGFEERGVFNTVFVDVMNERRYGVKDAFTVIRTKLRTHNQKYDDKKQMNPLVEDGLLFGMRSLHDPLDLEGVDIVQRDKLATQWRDYHRLPVEFPRIAGEHDGLRLYPQFQVVHTNCFDLHITVESQGIYEKITLRLDNIPEEIGGPSLQPTTQDNVKFTFHFKYVQRLKHKLQPELTVTCDGDKEMSAKFVDRDLAYPLLSSLEDWRAPIRQPTETEDSQSDCINKEKNFKVPLPVVVENFDLNHSCSPVSTVCSETARNMADTSNTKVDVSKTKGDSP